MSESQRIYRSFLSSVEGKRVFAHMLAEGKFFEYTKTPEEQAVENFLKTILCNLGVWNIENADSFVELLTNLPVKEIKNG